MPCGFQKKEFRPYQGILHCISCMCYVYEWYSGRAMCFNVVIYMHVLCFSAEVAWEDSAHIPVSTFFVDFFSSIFCLIFSSFELFVYQRLCYSYKLRVAFATEYSFIWSTLWCYFSSLVLFSMASISLNVRTYHAELNIYHLCQHEQKLDDW